MPFVGPAGLSVDKKRISECIIDRCEMVIALFGCLILSDSNDRELLQLYCEARANVQCSLYAEFIWIAAVTVYLIVYRSNDDVLYSSGDIISSYLVSFWFFGASTKLWRDGN